MPDISIQCSEVPEFPQAVEIQVTGAVTAQNAVALRDEIRRRIQGKTLFILLGLREVPYVNSSGFGSLIDTAVDLERRGGALLLVEVPTKVKLMFENLGVASYFQFEPTFADARHHATQQLERSQASPRVVLLSGNGGPEFPIVGSSIRIGSDPKSTISIRHPQVDLKHAEVYRTGDRCFVRDLGSRFGTYIGERKVYDEPLNSGDVIRVGGARLLYVPAGAKKR